MAEQAKVEMAVLDANDGRYVRIADLWLYIAEYGMGIADVRREVHDDPSIPEWQKPYADEHARGGLEVVESIMGSLQEMGEAE